MGRFCLSLVGDKPAVCPCFLFTLYSDQSGPAKHGRVVRRWACHLINIRAHHVTSSCVVSSFPNSRMAFNCWKTDPLNDWLPQRDVRLHCTASCIGVFCCCCCLVFLEGGRPLWLRQTCFIQMNERTCFFARSPKLVWMQLYA